MRILTTVVVLAAVGACAPVGPYQVEEENPTVSYTIYDDDDIDEAALEADEFCYENYRLSARVADELVTSDERVVTFECVGA